MLCPHCRNEVEPTAVYCVRCGKTVSGDEPERDYLYEAFISYRHTPHDQRVARRIQRAIEGRTIPKGLRDTAGRARLGKCFRDEDELPTDASLSMMITDALERSRWLIVICSPAMRESRWCAQEVKTFCELHGRDRVLLALSDGEPDEAFPLILQSRAVVMPDGTVVDEPFEPIAADLREGTGKRFSAEALRLVAPLMGCGYDDLRQRERMRRARLVSSIAAIIAAVSVAFGAFSYSQQLQIDANYQASLRNQSAYLATESADLLSTGDRMQAAQVAYAALPVGDHATRPYVPAAQMALADALQVYPMGGQWHPCYSRLLDEAFVHDVIVSPDGSRCAVSDSDGTLYVWDTVSGKIMRIEAPDHEEDFIVVSDPCFRGDELVCGYDSLLVRYDLETGETIESVDVEKLYDRSDWPMFTSDYDALVVSADGRLAAFAGDFGYDDSSVVIYDMEAGQLVQVVQFAVPEDAEANFLTDKHVVSFDSDGSHLVVAQGTFIISVDVATGKVTALVSKNGVISDLQMTDDAVIVGFCKATDEEKSVFDTSVRALDTATLEEHWAYHLDGQRFYIHDAAPLAARTKYPRPAFHGIEELEDAQRLLVTIGGTAHLIDPDTGESTYDCDIGKHLVGAGASQIAHVNGYGYENSFYLVLVTVDGQIITHSLSRDFAVELESGHRTSTNDDYLTQASMFTCGETPYLITRSGSGNREGNAVVWRCDDLQELPGYEEVADSINSLITRSVDGTYLAPNSWYSGNDAVSVLDATTISPAATITLSDEITSAVLCFSDTYDDVLYAVESNFETSTLRSYDATTGTCIGEVRGLLTEPLDLEECERILQSRDDKLYLLCVEKDADGHERVILRTVDVRTLEEQDSQELDMGDGYFSTIGLDVTAVTSELFACERSNQLLVWRLSDGSQLDCELAQSALRDGYLMVASPDGSAVLVASGGVLRCYGASGSLQWERPFHMKPYGSANYLAYTPDGRIVGEDESGELMLIDAATGEIVTSDLTSYYVEGISWFSADGTRLYAQAREAEDTSGFFSLVVIRLDPDEFGIETAAYYADAMTPDGERFICSTNTETYTLPYWSLEDLAARAEEITAGHELTEAERRLYHLQ